jgi:NitT/TauT family transport system permease protein
MASIASFIYGWQGMHSVFNGRDLPVISLDYHVLPYYTLRTTMRLVIGLFTQCYFQLSSRFWQQNMHR